MFMHFFNLHYKYCKPRHNVRLFKLPHLRIPQTVKINILIGAEHYYCFIDGNVIRGKINELIAVEPLLR